MFVLGTKSERFVALALAALMAATRIHHFGIGAIAPDASTAVFFLAGLLLGNPLYILVFAVEAVALDAVALGLLAVSDACMTAGYWLLFAGYAALWFAGRLARSTARLDLAAGAKLLLLLTAGVGVFFVLSNIGYYIGSEYSALGIQEYAMRVSRYLPYYWIVAAAYAAASIAVFALATRGRSALATR